MNYFRNFAVISLCIRAWPFIWINLNTHHPRLVCAKFGWNWSRTWFWRRGREWKTTKTYNGQSWFEPLAKVSQNLLVIIVWYIIPLDIIGKIKLSTRSPLKLEVEVESEGESSLFAMMYSCLESQADRRPTFAGLSKDSKKNKWYVLRFLLASPLFFYFRLPKFIFILNQSTPLMIGPHQMPEYLV